MLLHRAAGQAWKVRSLVKWCWATAKRTSPLCFFHPADRPASTETFCCCSQYTRFTTLLLTDPDEKVQQSARSTRHGVFEYLTHDCASDWPVQKAHLDATVSPLSPLTSPIHKKGVSDYLCKFWFKLRFTTSVISPSVSRPVPACRQASFATFLLAARSCTLDLTQDWSPRSSRNWEA